MRRRGKDRWINWIVTQFRMYESVHNNIWQICIYLFVDVVRMINVVEWIMMAFGRVVKTSWTRVARYWVPCSTIILYRLNDLKAVQITVLIMCVFSSFLFFSLFPFSSFSFSFWFLFLFCLYFLFCSVLLCVVLRRSSLHMILM